MPISLKNIASNTASVTFEYAEQPCTVTYYPGRITEKVFADLKAFESMNEASGIVEGFAALNSMLVKLLKSWDVYEDDEESVMFPLDAERFGELPIAFRLQVLSSVLGDIRPNEMAAQKTKNS